MSESDDDYSPSDHDQEINPSGRRPSVSEDSTVSTTISEASTSSRSRRKQEVSKRDPTQPKKRMRKARSIITPRIGQKYGLRDGREGECRFFGETKFAEGEWVGIVLDDEFEGKNDGTVKDKRYFKCTMGRGIMVKQKQLECEVHKVQKNKRVGDIGVMKGYKTPVFKTVKAIKKEEVDVPRVRQLGPRDYGRNSDYEVLKFKEAPKKKVEEPIQRVRSLGPRDFKRDTEYEMPKFKKAEKKPAIAPLTRQRSLGPREMGRNLDYEMPKFKKKKKKAEKVIVHERALGPRDYERDSEFEMPKFKKKKKKDSTRKSLPRERKPGPRDIGKASDYKMPKFRDSRSRSESADVQERVRERKPGPRDIGKNSEYKMPKFKQVKKKKAAEYVDKLEMELKENVEYIDRLKTVFTKSKRDHAALKIKLKESKQEVDRLKTELKEAKNEMKRLGREKSVSAAKYDIKDDGDGFLGERISKVSNAPKAKVERKAGPREIGKNKDWKAADYGHAKGEPSIDLKALAKEDFTKERTSASKKDKEPAKVEKKLGPREIGKIKYNPPKFDIKEDDGDFLSERTLKKTKSESVVVKKLGPRDIGRNEYDAAKFETKKKRLSSSTKSKSKSTPSGLAKTGFKKPKFTRKIYPESDKQAVNLPPDSQEQKRQKSKGDPTKKDDGLPKEATEEKKEEVPEVSQVEEVEEAKEEPKDDDVEEKQLEEDDVASHIESLVARAELLQSEEVSESKKQEEEEEEVISKEEHEEEEEEVPAVKQDETAAAAVADDDDTDSDEDLNLEETTEEQTEDEIATETQQKQPAEASESDSAPKQGKGEKIQPIQRSSVDETFCRGLYTMQRASWLRELIDVSSHKIRKVNTGEFVNVTGIVNNADRTRLRGKVDNGYITLRNNETGQVFVRLIRQTQDTEDADESSVEITESDDEENVQRPPIMADWENDDVLSWIETMPSLRKYSEDFEIGEVDGDDLISYTDEDLKSLGVESSVHRKLLLSAVKKHLEG